MLKVATFNPGRCGLLALDSDTVLDWRIENIAATLQENSIHVCALPGARITESWRPPEGFPYDIFGNLSPNWDGVLLLVSPELSSKVVELNYEGDSTREFWIRLPPTKSNAPGCVIGAAYPKHGGDKDMWKSILRNYRKFTQEFPLDRCFILCDANIHLLSLIHI